MTNLQRALFAAILSTVAGQALARGDHALVQYNMEFKRVGSEAMSSPTIRTVSDEKAAISFWDKAGKDSISVEVTPKVSRNGIATFISLGAYGDSFSTVMRGDFKLVFSTDKRGHLVADIASVTGRYKGHVVLGTNTTLSGASLMVHPSIYSEQH